MKPEAALDKHQERLMAIPEVAGVGLGGSEHAPIIVVMVKRGGRDITDQLPSTLEGYPVKVEVTGEITAE
jgi:hypothetical protein